MHRRAYRMAAIGLALVLCVVAPAGVSARTKPRKAARPSSALLGGVNIGAVGYDSPPAEAQALIAAAHALQAKVVRVEVPWAVFEPQSPEHVEAGPLAYADRLLGDASTAGIRVIMDVDDTPCWASSAPTAILSGCNPASRSQANAWPPSNPAAYAAFVAFLSARYGTGLAAIEVWNEPDESNEAYFAGPEKAVRYAAVLRAAYPAIKAANTSVAVLAGALVGSNGVFLRDLYAAGIKGYYDGLAVHYYNLTLGSLRSIHEAQLANGDTTPVWLDEFGWSSCWPARSIEQEQGCVTPQIQARNIADTLRTLARTPWVAAAVLYKLQDSPLEEFGLLSPTGARKPAFAAFAHALSAPFANVSPVTLSLRRRGTRVIAAGSGPVGDFMQLEVFKGGVLRYRSLFTLNRFNRYSITLPSVLGDNALRVRVFQYWSGVASAARKRI
ncbi:MAG: cellulase family glycosylhydrolase [Solirubrobacteraceae bacterium]